MHAVSSAGVVYSLARACRDGQMQNCGCSRGARPKNLQQDWIWGGCGDNIEYGYRFAENFIDVKEKEQRFPKSSKPQARKLMNLHNNEAGRRVSLNFTQKFAGSLPCRKFSGSCSCCTFYNTSFCTKFSNPLLKSFEQWLRKLSVCLLRVGL